MTDLTLMIYPVYKVLSGCGVWGKVWQSVIVYIIKYISVYRSLGQALCVCVCQRACPRLCLSHTVLDQLCSSGDLTFIPCCSASLSKLPLLSSGGANCYHFFKIWNTNTLNLYGTFYTNSSYYAMQNCHSSLLQIKLHERFQMNLLSITGTSRWLRLTVQDERGYGKCGKQPNPLISEQ